MKQIENIRHSLAHILAMAVLDMFPEAKLAIGPTIEDGFYYDFDLPRTLVPEDLENIQNKMRQLVSQKLEFIKKNVPINEALDWAKSGDKIFKKELIEELAHIGEKELSFYVTKQGDKELFTDLCKGSHVQNTSEIPVDAFKLTDISGAYWRGDEDNQMLQRIYGVAFGTKKELKVYLNRQEEALKRDHRKLGKELDLFTFSKLVGSGLPMFTPKGTRIREALVNFIDELQNKKCKRPFDKVFIPHIAKADLYKVSGHWDKFKDDLFHVKGKSKAEFVMKPMNCPHHTQIYASQPRSYKDLPIRYSEVTTVYRDEQPGELQGLSRVRALTQDDGHVFCTADQVKAEVMSLYDIIEAFYKQFDIKIDPHLSLSDPNEPDKYLGNKEEWAEAEAVLEEVLQERAKGSFVKDEGEAAFYGPKIDFVSTDALGRKWQLATIQYDTNMPARFELEYIDKDGEAKRPIMIHRAILGSVERFMSILIEHYGGKFPFWLSPEQIRIITVSDKVADYAMKVAAKLNEANLYVEIDDSSETIGKKIRAAKLAKVPLVLVVGDKEAASNKLIASPNVREDLKDFAEEIKRNQTENVIEVEKLLEIVG